jgi:phenol hydroxylase P4 protein
MAVTSLKEYIGVPRDTVANFNGKQLVYASWDQHLLFAAPFLTCVPPGMKFKEWVEGPLTALIQPDPDAKRVDFSKVEWLKSNKAWSPKFEASLADNGVVHKEQIRFRTPNLNTLRDAG